MYLKSAISRAYWLPLSFRKSSRSIRILPHNSSSKSAVFRNRRRRRKSIRKRLSRLKAKTIIVSLSSIPFCFSSPRLRRKHRRRRPGDIPHRAMRNCHYVFFVRTIVIRNNENRNGEKRENVLLLDKSPVVSSYCSNIK